MKLNSLLILTALIVSSLSPLTGPISLTSTDQVKYFVSLDVCHASGAATSVNADAPSLPERPFTQVPVEFTELIKTNKVSYSPSLFSIQIDRPPRAYSEI